MNNLAEIEGDFAGSMQGQNVTVPMTEFDADPSDEQSRPVPVPRRPPQRRRVTFMEDVVFREMVDLEALLTPSDSAAYPGVALTREALGNERERARVIRLISKLAAEDVGWSGSEPSRVSEIAAATAKAFARALPPNVVNPVVAPDGDGGLLLLWEHELLVVVECGRLHIVFRPATSNASYIDDVPYHGGELPPGVMGAIPRK